MTGTETGIETETETGIGEPGIVCQEEEKMIETASDMTGVEVILTLLMTIGEPAGPFLHDVQVRAYPSSLDNNLIWFLDRYRSRSPRSRRPFSPPRRPRYSRSPPPSRRHMYNDGRACTRQGKHCMKLMFCLGSPRRRSRSRTPERRRRDHSRESQNRPRPLDAPTSPSKRRASRSPSRARPIHKSPDVGPLVAQNSKITEQRAEAPSTQNGPSQPTPDRVHRSKDTSLGDKLEQRPSHPPPAVAQRSPRHIESNKNESRSPKREPQTQQDTNVKRSPSPPRQPRHMGNQPARDGQYSRRTSRSPPRGPRNAAKIFSAPGATPPSHTTGAHGGRRPPPPGRPAHGPHDLPNLAEPHTKRSNRLERAPVTASLDAEVT